MFIFTIISFILIAFLLMGMLANARPLSKMPLPGKTLANIPLGIWPKLQVHRSNLLALLTGLAFGVIAGWLPINVAGMVAVFAVVVLLMPMEYTLTTQGVAVGPGIFRPWDEFSGYASRKSSLVLLRPNSPGNLTLFVKPAQMDNVVKYVDRHVKAQHTNL